jgi:hypothetical protein
MRNQISALYYMERKTWFCFPVEYDGENLFSPWSKILDCAAHRSYGFGQRREPLVSSFQTSIYIYINVHILFMIRLKLVFYEFARRPRASASHPTLVHVQHTLSYVDLYQVRHGST